MKYIVTIAALLVAIGAGWWYVASQLVALPPPVSSMLATSSVQEANITGAASAATPTTAVAATTTLRSQNAAEAEKIASQAPARHSYQIVSTGVTTFYNNTGVIARPPKSSVFYGQDAAYQFVPPSYTDNGDGTVTDNNTGLMWQKDMGHKMTLAQAEAEASASTLGGHHDWRVADIKELFSLILYTGQVRGNTPIVPFIDTKYFDQPAGGEGMQFGDRPIDAQTLSATPSVARTMAGDSSIFGVNFVDGHLKAYPVVSPATGTANLKYYRLVRGDTAYGKNDFVSNGNGTVTDRATGLTWQQADSGRGMDWEHALGYCESLSLAGKDDWRLPSVKELQSLVDYSRSPETTRSPAIDSIFKTTQITDPDGTKDYPYSWSATTFLESARAGDEAAYVAFGRSLGKLRNGALVDAHGAGAVRSDPKTGSPSDYPQYFGPENDQRTVFNYVRCVRGM